VHETDSHRYLWRVLAFIVPGLALAALFIPSLCLARRARLAALILQLGGLALVAADLYRTQLEYGRDKRRFFERIADYFAALSKPPQFSVPIEGSIQATGKVGIAGDLEYTVPESDTVEGRLHALKAALKALRERVANAEGALNSLRDETAKAFADQAEEHARLRTEIKQQITRLATGGISVQRTSWMLIVLGTLLSGVIDIWPELFRYEARPFF